MGRLAQGGGPRTVWPAYPQPKTNHDVVMQFDFNQLRHSIAELLCHPKGAAN